jgi:ribonuclease T2
LLLSRLAGEAMGQDGSVDHYILALTWQPAFCQYHPGLPECPGEGVTDEPDAPHLTLHGLWPSDTDNSGLSYCGVGVDLRALDERRQWCEIPEPAISVTARESVDAIMPGARSCLDRHQWLKHGTCSGLDQDAYFRLASRFAGDIARTAVGRSIDDAAGGVIEAKRVRAAFEDRFGAGSARALSLRCRKDGGRSYLSALWIRLSPAISGLDPGQAALKPELLDLRTPGRDRSCPALIYIDAPGL